MYAFIANMFYSHDMDPHDNDNMDSRDNDNMDDLVDLPTTWNINDKSDSLSISSDGLEVKYTGENN